MSDPIEDDDGDTTTTVYAKRLVGDDDCTCDEGDHDCLCGWRFEVDVSLEKHKPFREFISHSHRRVQQDPEVLGMHSGDDRAQGRDQVHLVLHAGARRREATKGCRVSRVPRELSGYAAEASLL
jgi:hypothetical protein